MQPIKVHLCPPGPNPWKVVVVLEELGVPYEVNSFEFDHVKHEPFTKLNPNGRVPAIEDPNTGLVLWETGAIILYLIETYDTKKLLTSDDAKARHLQNQWLMFQVSGQGPYFGQAAWFNHLHPTKIESAQERYNGEIQRILSVLDGALTGRQWLVGDKMTYADLAFVPWNERIDAISPFNGDQKYGGNANVQAWHERMTSRPAWKKSMELRKKCMAEQGLQENGMPIGINTFEEYKAHMAEKAAKAQAAAQ